MSSDQGHICSIVVAMQVGGSSRRVRVRLQYTSFRPRTWFLDGPVRLLIIGYPARSASEVEEATSDRGRGSGVLKQTTVRKRRTRAGKVPRKAAQK